jgi:capsule polysaccharide export protein KpsE/RkpR
MDLSSVAGSDEGAYNVTIFPEMATSKPFLASLLKCNVSPSPKSKIRKKTGKVNMSLYDYYTDSTRITTTEKVLGGIKKILHLEKKDSISNINKIDYTHYTKRQEELIKKMSSSVDVVINKKTGITTISFTCDDPAVAQQIADTVSCRLQAMVINYKTLKAKEKLKYYTKISDEARIRLIKLQKKNSQIRQNKFHLFFESLFVVV